MSTIYVFHQEITTSVASSAADTGDLFPCYDTSAGRTSYYGGAAMKALINGVTSLSTVGFFGATATAQPAGTNQQAVTSTAIAGASATVVTSTTPFGFSTSTQATSVLTAVSSTAAIVTSLLLEVDAIRSALVALGLMKGSA